MPELTATTIKRFLAEETWRQMFDGFSLTKGKKLSQSKYISSVKAELLDSGDWELLSLVMEPDGHQHESIISFWIEDGEVVCDTSCDCSQRAQCPHNVATLLYLSKADRVDALWDTSPVDSHIEKANEKGARDAALLKQIDQLKQRSEVQFKIRVEKKPETKEHAWIPDFYAHAYAIYDEIELSLEPSGNYPSSEVKRNRAAEMDALNILYALDLQPFSGHPPQALKKLAKAPVEATCWAPNKKEWPVADYYWQRFRHEATLALEKRGWSVEFSHQVALRPLVFKAEGWRAEMVEEGKGWFSLSAGFEIDGEQFEIQPILATLLEYDFMELTEGMPKGQEFLIFLPDGRALAVPVGRFRHLITTLGHLISFKFNDGPIKIREIDAAQLASDDSLELDSPEVLDELVERVKSASLVDEVNPPSSLNADLRSYQLEGFRWMQFLVKHRLNGILADDMGLGKTLQTIAHILAEKDSGRDTSLPSLVIAPTSVVMNWQREISKFTEGLSVLVLQGGSRHGLFAQIQQADVVLTSYALIHRDIEKFEKELFHLVVLDEAQHIKNPQAQVSQAVKRLNSNHRLCLSGTPVENHLGELWSLMSFLMPELLGAQDSFNETYRTPIEKSQNQSAKDSLNRRVGPLILRRTKHAVAKELPPKTEIVHTVQMTNEQKDLYETVRATMDKKVRQALAAKGREAQIIFLDALLKLRQICCHPSLLENNQDATQSGKFEYLIDLLTTLRSEGHRTLIFSQFTSMLDLIEAYLKSEEISYLKLTGATKNRQDLVERFQGGEGEVFLISLKAGGTGLTLTGADNVIHYDPWWNPAAENQATDRAYRIGQDKPVFVHKLICESTVEQRIQQMQAKKNTIADNILDGATDGFKVDEQLRRDLFD